jgi:hypothetical protein
MTIFGSSNGCFESEDSDVRFTGMKPPETDVPLIELQTTDGRVVDLYNEHWLHSGIVRGDELTFEFVAADPTVTAVLRFLKVRNLRVVQPEDWAQGEAEQIEFKAGGLDYEFDCAEFRLETQVTSG